MSPADGVHDTITAVLAGYAWSTCATPFKRVLTAVLVASLFFPTRVTAITGIYEVQREPRLHQQDLDAGFPLHRAQCCDLHLHHARRVSRRSRARSLRCRAGSTAPAACDAARYRLPIIKNGIVVVIIVSSSYAWGEFLLALTLMNDGEQADAAGLHRNCLRWQRRLALAADRSTLHHGYSASLIVFAIAQRWYTKGLQEGALKA